MSIVSTCRAAPLGLAVLLAASGGLGCSSEKCERHTDCATGYYCSPTGNCEPVVIPDGSGEDVVREDAPRDDAGEVDGEADASTCTAVEECDDGDPCTNDSCDGDAGICVHAPASDGTACNDGDLCNGVDTCRSGVCEHGVAAPDDTDCDDGVYCNGVASCLGGTCVNPGPPCEPEAIAGCMRTGCHEDLDDCGRVPVINGTFCSLISGVCGSTTGTCLDGTCQVGPTDVCDDDGNTCTDNYCTPDGDGTNPICTYLPVADRTPCGPDEMCLGAAGRICIAGTCSIGSSPPCTDGSLCVRTDCNPGGECEPGVPATPFPTLACDSSATGSTVLSRNDVTAYGSDCAGYFDGGENVWRLTTPGTGTVEIRLNDDDAVGSLVLLGLPDACNPASCEHVSDMEGVLTLDATGAVTVYVVVDGVGAARGPYSLEVSCY